MSQKLRISRPGLRPASPPTELSPVHEGGGVAGNYRSRATFVPSINPRHGIVTDETSNEPLIPDTLPVA